MQYTVNILHEMVKCSRKNIQCNIGLYNEEALQK